MSVVPAFDTRFASAFTVAVDFHLSPTRAQRWREVLRSGKRLDRVSCVDLFDPAYRHAEAKAQHFKHVKAWTEALSSVRSHDAVGLGRFDSTQQSFWCGYVEEFLGIRGDRQFLDAWVYVPSLQTSLACAEWGDLIVVKRGP